MTQNCHRQLKSKGIFLHSAPTYKTFLKIQIRSSALSALTAYLENERVVCSSYHVIPESMAIALDWRIERLRSLRRDRKTQRVG